jgi:transglutaminase-like putative cysteine protease
MRSLVLKARGDEKLRAAAVGTVRGCAPHDDRCRMARLLGYVRSGMPFERDPVDVESIADPRLSLERILAHGEAAGDCDDAAVLLAALLEAIGIRCRFAAVSIRPDRVFHHVAVEAQDRRLFPEGWTILDPYGAQEVGAHPAFTAVQRVAV